MSFSFSSPDLGYIFYPLAHPGDPGHPQLDIHLPSAPSGRHFDVAAVHFSIFTATDLIERLSVSRHHLGPFEGRVCPGRIIIESFTKKTVEAFTFGGTFQVEMQPDLTICTIRSKAPILEIIHEETVSSMLAEEVEILLAGRRAAWAEDPEGLARRLAGLDPITFYHACLEELRRKFKLLPHLQNSFSITFTQFLNTECREFESKYGQGDLAQSFEELL
jgi:hypothetical protein